MKEIIIRAAVDHDFDIATADTVNGVSLGCWLQHIEVLSEFTPPPEQAEPSHRTFGGARSPYDTGGELPGNSYRSAGLAQAAGGVGLDDWSKTKPVVAGAYRVRGFDSNGTTALVEVLRDDDGELRCNIHERNSEDRVDRWCFMDEISDDFEWLVIAAQQQPEVDRG